MCMEDIRLGRESKTGEKTVTVQTSSTLLVGPDKFRTSLIISTGVTNRVTLSVNNPAVNGSGMILHAGTAPLKLCLANDGDIVTRGFYAIANAASEVITVWETSLAKD